MLQLFMGENRFIFPWHLSYDVLFCFLSLNRDKINQRTSGPVNAHLISWPSKAQNIQNLESFHKKFSSDQQSSS